MDKRGQHFMGTADISILIFGMLIGIALVVFAVRYNLIPIELVTGMIQQPAQ